MKFSQENTLKFIQHSDLFPSEVHSKEGLTFTLQHIHCCLKISIMRDYKDFTQSSDANVLDQKYYPLIIDGDKLKVNYSSITGDSKNSVDVVFVTEGNDLIFTEYKFNKISFNKIFKTLSNKINDFKEILSPLQEKYSFHSICYVLYKAEDIEQVKSIYRQKCDEIDDPENIYKKCQPMSLEEWYGKFFV